MKDIMFPDEIDVFLRNHWPDDLFVRPAHLERAEKLLEIPEIGDLDALLECFDAPISLRRPEGRADRVNGSAAAKAAYDEGATLYFRKVEDFVPALKELLAEVAETLGLLPTLMSIEVFASNGPSGVAMHADYDVNFQLLLRGEKTWRIAPNTHVRNPTEMCLPATHPVFDAFQLEIADRTPFPTEMPQDAMCLEMTAGSLIFVPCGWWHSTQAKGECFAVNVVCKGPRMADVLAEGLRRWLLRDPTWREYASGNFGNGCQLAGPPASRRFDVLLARLTTALSAKDPVEFADTLIKEFKAINS